MIHWTWCCTELASIRGGGFREAGGIGAVLEPGGKTLHDRPDKGVVYGRGVELVPVESRVYGVGDDGMDFMYEREHGVWEGLGGGGGRCAERGHAGDAQ